MFSHECSRPNKFGIWDARDRDTTECITRSQGARSVAAKCPSLHFKVRSVIGEPYSPNGIAIAHNNGDGYDTSLCMETTALRDQDEHYGGGYRPQLARRSTDLDIRCSEALDSAPRQ